MATLVNKQVMPVNSSAMLVNIVDCLNNVGYQHTMDLLVNNSVMLANILVTTVNNLDLPVNMLIEWEKKKHYEKRRLKKIISLKFFILVNLPGDDGK